MEPDRLIPNSQELSSCSYPEPDQSSPQHPIPTRIIPILINNNINYQALLENLILGVCILLRLWYI
jgi:hypothetical protein